jgi:hypothetical protein
VYEGFLLRVKMDPNEVLPVDERKVKEDGQAGKFEF